MDNKGGVRESRVYVIIAILVIVAIIVIVLFGTNTFTPAYIPDDILDDGWTENLLERESGSGLFGFERWTEDEKTRMFFTDKANGFDEFSTIFYLIWYIRPYFKKG